MKFQKGRPPEAVTRAEQEFVRAFRGQRFMAEGTIVASGSSHWSNSRGSKGWDYAWALVTVPGFPEPVYVKTERGGSSVLPRGSIIEIEISPRVDESVRAYGLWFDIQPKIKYLNPPSYESWEDALSFIEGG